MSVLKDNQDIFKTWIKEYSSALKIKEVFNDDISQKGFYSFMLEFKNWLYYSIHEILTPNKYDKNYELTIRTYCNYIRDKILPVCYAKIKHYNNSKKEQSHIFLNKWLDLEDDYYALAAYRDLKLTALYLERGKNNKIWAKTIHLFENFFYYTQKIVFGEEIELIRASYFPGAGKTFACNILCAFWFGYDSNMSILRITYSDDLCSIFITQIGDIINSKQFRKIFPQFDKGEETGNMELYSKYSIAVGFQFSFSNGMNFYASTRDGQTTGKRGKVLIIDDLTKGVDEANDEKLHQKMENKYDTEWCSRADTSYQPVIAVGTMWSKLDLLNKIYNRALKDTENNIVNDTLFKYTEIGYNNDNSINSVFISTPILDYDTDESTCPLRYTTEKMKKKRSHMEKFLWDAVYQQRPTPPQEFLFSYNNLETYNDNTYPKELLNRTNNYECWAFIDPNRKGTDFCSMPILKRYTLSNGEKSKWYFSDCIHQQKPTKELMYEIAGKIKTHHITRFGFENNIDASFDDNLYYKLKEIGCEFNPQIDAFFSYGISKGNKIFCSASGMKNDIVYPEIGLYDANSEIGKAMNQLTSWFISQKEGKHDDFPDAIAMFVKYYCEEEEGNGIQFLDDKITL